MPIYEYKCSDCDNHFDLMRKMDDSSDVVCPKCGGTSVNKLISAPAIRFKGAGFYLNDYAKGHSSMAAKADGESCSSASDHGGGCACCSHNPKNQ